MISVVRRTMQKDEMPQQSALLRRSVLEVIMEHQGESLSVSTFLEERKMGLN
jgi:hypothetical protein